VSTSHEPFDTFAALHAVGALDGDDLRAFEAHLGSGCSRCIALVRQTEQALARAAMAGPPESPPSAIRERLVKRAAAAGAPGRRRWLPWTIGIVAAAVAAGAFSAAYVAARYEARLGQMAREASTAKERVARTEADLREELALLRDPTTRMVELRGQGAAPGAVARVLWADGAGGLLLATRLPPPPPGKVYALWTLAGDVPRVAGVFVPDDTGRATLKVAAEATGAPLRVLSVTAEPEGGAAAPSGAIALAPR
jgi:anti-sigma-K factor RskA